MIIIRYNLLYEFANLASTYQTPWIIEIEKYINFKIEIMVIFFLFCKLKEL